MYIRERCLHKTWFYVRDDVIVDVNNTVVTCARGEWEGENMNDVSIAGTSL